MSKNVQTPISFSLNSPMASTALRPSATRMATPIKTFLTPSSVTKVPSRKFMRRSFTPIGLNYASSPIMTPIEKAKELEASRDFLEMTLTPNASSTILFDGGKRTAFSTPQHSVGKKVEINRTFTVSPNHAIERKKIDDVNCPSMRRALHLSMNSPSMAVQPKSPKVAKYDFSPVEFDERPPTPMPGHNAAERSGSTFVVDSDILNHSISIRSLLEGIGMEKYIEKFENEEIDLFVFSLMTADDLIALDIDEADRPAFVQAFETYADNFGAVDISQ